MHSNYYLTLAYRVWKLQILLYFLLLNFFPPLVVKSIAYLHYLIYCMSRSFGSNLFYGSFDPVPITGASHQNFCFRVA